MAATGIRWRRGWYRYGHGRWQRNSVDPAIDTRLLLPWWTHRTGVRLLGFNSLAGRWVAELALADLRGGWLSRVPFWFRLRVDLETMRVVGMRMIAPAHFMDHRYHGFNSPIRIRPPTGRG